MEVCSISRDQIGETLALGPDSTEAQALIATIRRALAQGAHLVDSTPSEDEDGLDAGDFELTVLDLTLRLDVFLAELTGVQLRAALEDSARPDLQRVVMWEMQVGLAETVLADGGRISGTVRDLCHRVVSVGSVRRFRADLVELEAVLPGELLPEFLVNLASVGVGRSWRLQEQVSRLDPGSFSGERLVELVYRVAKAGGLDVGDLLLAAIGSESEAIRHEAWGHFAKWGDVGGLAVGLSRLVEAAEVSHDTLLLDKIGKSFGNRVKPASKRI